MKGEWAWEWAACVRNGRTGVSDPCGPCGWWGLVHHQKETSCPACIWTAHRSCPPPACFSWTCWTSYGCVSGFLLSSWSGVCWPVESNTLARTKQKISLAYISEHQHVYQIINENFLEISHMLLCFFDGTPRVFLVVCKKKRKKKGYK